LNYRFDRVLDAIAQIRLFEKLKLRSCARKQKAALARTFAVAAFRESTSSFDPIVRASDCIAGAAANSPLVGKWRGCLRRRPSRLCTIG
jgi:hypothetical protein